MHYSAKADALESRIRACESRCRSSVGDIVKFGFRVITAKKWNM